MILIINNWGSCNGGCCLPGEGGCTITTLVECLEASGTFLGQGTDCESGCTGPCCLTSGCQLMAEPQCAALNGTFAGYNSTCEDSCPGACCLPDGRCVLATVSMCDSLGGVFAGIDTTCNDCPGVGACCLPDGPCASNLTEVACQYLGGTFEGPDTTCYKNPCPPPTPPVTGACCSSSGSCSVSTEAQCQASDGTWVGADTTCSPTPCGGSGTCCLPSGSCVQGLTSETCLTMGGSLSGGCSATGFCCQPMCAQCPDELTIVLPGFNYNGFTQFGIPYVVTVGSTTHVVQRTGSCTWQLDLAIVGSGTIHYPSVPCTRNIDVWTYSTGVGCWPQNNGSKGWWININTAGLTGTGCDLGGIHNYTGYYTKAGSCQGAYERVPWSISVMPLTLTAN